MDFLNSRMNRRTVGGLGIGVAAAAGLGRFVMAQDATPEVSEEAVTQPVLAEYEGASHMTVTASKYSYSVRQSGENVPGWYVFDVTNASEADVAFNLALLPEGVEPGAFTSALFQVISGNTAELPEWWSDVVYAGGTFVPVGGTNSALVELSEGEWIIFSNLKASQQSITKITIGAAEEAEVAVEATPEATTEEEVVSVPEGFGSHFTVSVTDDAINADSSLAAGYNVLGVRNDASTSASFVVLHSTEAVDDAAAASIASSWLIGESTDAQLVGGMGALSPNKFGYVEITAEPGTYIGFSSGINAEGGSHIEDGAVTIFTVA